MSMTTAAQIINEINSTRIRQATKSAGRTLKAASQRPQRPASQYSVTSGTTLRSVPPPPKSAPVRRKQVPDKSGITPAMLPEHVPVPKPKSSPDRETLTKRPDEQGSFIEPLGPLEPLEFDSSDIALPGTSRFATEPVPAQRKVSAPVLSELKSGMPLLPEAVPKTQSEEKAGKDALKTVSGSEDHLIQASDVISTSTPSLSEKLVSSPIEPPIAAAPAESVSTPAHVGHPRPAHRRRKKVGLDDFSFLAVLGKGNFGKVMLAESKHTGNLYAVKVLKKNFIVENREVESTRSEKRVFLIANRERHPFLINLFACFQTENRIYFVMDYVSGGDLMFHIQQKMFTARRAQFYAAEVLLALKHFHENGVIYRDLKLDNILLSLDGHIKLADYGLCKENMDYGSTTGTFCGTPDFIAPEILLDQKYGRSVDWWALGVLMYQMLLGKSPFHGNDEDEVYDAILSDEPLYPIHMPRDSVSILQQLLTRDPSKRLGSGIKDAEEIMSHPYFANISFEDLLNLRVEPPYKPELDSPTDVRYFERDFTSEMPALTPMNSTVTPEMQEEFRGFSYSMGDSI